MPNKQQLWWMATGVIALLVIKYPLVGLHTWNGILHPCRKDDPNGLFYNPLMGVFIR
jgi:hypothetical protein